MRENCWKEIFEVIPCACLVLKANSNSFTVVDANQAYLELIGTSKEELLSKDCEEAFPPNPGLQENHGHELLSSSLFNILKTGKKEEVNNFRYDIKNRITGKFEERYFSSQNIPVRNLKGR